MLTVLKAGMMTSVQDGGRMGWQRFGVPVCGAMDPEALAIANILCGNDETEAALELTGAGCAVRFESPNIFALAGADFSPRLNGVPIETGRAVLAKKGDQLETGFAKKGFRGVLAVAGGFDLPPVMGSRSTDLKGGFGGFQGRLLRDGDVLPFRDAQVWLPNLAERRAEMLRSAADSPLRVVLGPQDDSFSQRGIQTFLSGTYTVTSKSDRMGYRLEGPKIEYAQDKDGNIISDGIVMGAVQVPSGQPIIMMADRQTTGGYAKIAVVITPDLGRIAQMAAGHPLRFAAVTQDEAEALTCAWKKDLRRLRETLDEETMLW